MTTTTLPTAYGSNTLSILFDPADREASHKAQLRREERRGGLDFERHPFARMALTWED